jgi:aminopeptidase N
LSRSRQTRVFRGEKLRGFGLVIAERMKSVEQQSGQTRIVSYFREGDERLGKRALNIAARAVEAYTQAFGSYPYPILQIAEMPLPAGYSGTELPGLIALAQAYYIDFEAPHSVRLPGVLREQADVIKTAFEFTLAHGVAHQWWGSAVASDPERAPYVNEALASFSAAYYHEAAYGKPLGEIVIKQQLNGTYQAYRMLGGVDLEVDKPTKDFRSTLQFTAIVQAKGALLFTALRRELGEEKFFQALKSYYSAQRFRITMPEQLRGAFLNVAEDQRVVRGLFQRWLKEKHGDEDIGTPDLTLLPPPVSKIRTLGRVFVKIGKTAAKPF